MRFFTFNSVCGCNEETKKGSQRKKPDSGKLAIRRDHTPYTRRWIEIPFGVVGGPRTVVVSFKFHHMLWRVENCPFPFHWPVAYTTVQAVI